MLHCTVMEVAQRLVSSLGAKAFSSIDQDVTTSDLINNNSCGKFQDAREFRSNSTFGNYLVANRPIECGEVVAVETAFTVSASGPSNGMPYCLTCCRRIALCQRCTKCGWPVCNFVCESAPQHAETECRILLSAKVLPLLEHEEYTSLETLRCLLLRDSKPEMWQLMLQMEPHTEERSKNSQADAVTKFVINFIHNRCQLFERFSTEEIDHALGAIIINNFWGYDYTRRHSSMLFPLSISYLLHDCNPNVWKTIFIWTPNTTGNINGESVDPANEHYGIKLTSTRQIKPGEKLCVCYVNPVHDVISRGSELKKTFHFYCDCLRCRVELFDEINTNI